MNCPICNEDVAMTMGYWLPSQGAFDKPAGYRCTECARSRRLPSTDRPVAKERGVS